MKKKVLVGGVFDILHFGHIQFLKKAKKLGDYLIVALESDENVRKIKGEKRPIHNQNQRREILESLKFVDEVISLPEMKSDEDYKNLVIKVKPQVVAVTVGDPILEKKRKHASLIGARVIEIPKINVFSTSQIAKLLELE